MLEVIELPSSLILPAHGFLFGSRGEKNHVLGVKDFALKSRENAFQISRQGVEMKSILADAPPNTNAGRLPARRRCPVSPSPRGRRIKAADLLAVKPLRQKATLFLPGLKLAALLPETEARKRLGEGTC
jgi:hypothetical protein